MLLFGHIGITLGAAALAARPFKKRIYLEPAEKTTWFFLLSRYMDIRLLIIGSMLPDIIDKPVGQLIFRGTFSNGRIFAHTLFFLLLITAGGYFLYRRCGKSWMLILAAGTLAHVALDMMWKIPATLFWPLLGFHFPQYEIYNWVNNILESLMSNPYLYVSEAAGLVIFLWFSIWLAYRKKIRSFISRGKV
jgi:membrane-bound metal-dependent hydrolase YbcI (DUF457 family)